MRDLYPLAVLLECAAIAAGFGSVIYVLALGVLI